MKNKILLLLVFLIGCSSGSVRDCKLADWKVIGRIDEELGQSESKKPRHKKHCKQKFTEESWEEGRQVGAIFRCSANGAYYAGKKAQNFPSHCPPDAHMALNQAYQDGVYVAKQLAKLTELRSDLDEAKEVEAKKAQQKSSFTQDLGRWLFNGRPRSELLGEEISKVELEVHRLESKFIPPYALSYPE